MSDPVEVAIAEGRDIKCETDEALLAIAKRWGHHEYDAFTVVTAKPPEALAERFRGMLCALGKWSPWCRWGPGYYEFKHERTDSHIVFENPSNEATKGDRRTAIVLDEVASLPSDVYRNTRDSTKCRLADREPGANAT